MKITIVSGPFFPTPPAPTGAVQRIWSDLAEYFVGAGHQVTILACRYPGQPAEEERPVAGGGVVHIRRRTGLRQGRSVYRDLAKDSWYSLRMLSMLPKADILVTNAFWFPLFATWIGPRVGRVYVCVQRVPKGQFRLYKRAARFHAVSQAIADAIIAEQPTYRERVRVIPNPVDIEVFSPPARERLSGPKRQITFTGRIHPEKGLHVLVRAVGLLQRRHSGLELRLIGAHRTDQGGGGPSYLDTLRGLAAEAGVSLIISEPMFERRALAAALQEADIYCYPSLAEKGEASPVAPVEAMATGLAPVVSDIPQFRDYLTPGVTGLVFRHADADNAARLAESIGALLDDPAKARSMGDAARIKAKSLSYQSVASQFLADFESLTGGPRAA